MSYKIFSFAVGFLVWLLATIAFRFAGQYFFITSNPVVLTALYIAVIPILGLIATWVFNKYNLTTLESTYSAVLLVLPGMVLDTFCIEFFAVVFPNLPESDGTTFGSWLLWAYATVLVFGLLRKNKKGKEAV